MPVEALGGGARLGSTFLHRVGERKLLNLQRPILWNQRGAVLPAWSEQDERSLGHGLGRGNHQKRSKQGEQ